MMRYGSRLISWHLERYGSGRIHTPADDLLERSRELREDRTRREIAELRRRLVAESSNSSNTNYAESSPLVQN